MRTLLGSLIGLLLLATPAWGQTELSVDSLPSIADSVRHGAVAGAPLSPRMCRDQERSFRSRTRLSPSQRRDALTRCLSAAQAKPRTPSETAGRYVAK